MTRLTFATVAIAAGMTAFASISNAQPAAEAAPKTLVDLMAENAKKKGEGADIDPTETSSIAAGKAKPVAKRSSFDSLIAKYAAEHGVPVALAHAVVTVESNYRANARGRAGEIGLMQIKPATARMMGYSGSAKGLYDPETNIRFGMKYLGKARQLGGGDTCGTILRYNAGHAAKRMNRISAAYCAKVKRHLRQS